ncbi:class II fructose-1,6-bisphosphate aldolase [Heliorestis acidaminivorans]|uniref:Class II fructose-1,6-bisphosphate aldolase n=1 Tax=Heliorestis acidaminivorans TaxID=553427 RepID=A0A6I0EZ86_9FIRM|nr:class II fructose-1,6-bisphosphate aldolase [Heliorestis acidaminivorans]KAB2953826.1 class II fructose-1,6-bisphosphate aldolase [Heliorestis acidaminivorans]
MPMVTLAELMAKAEEGKYAVGAFNCNNMEIVQAIIMAAEAEKAPVIIQASQGAIKYAGLDYIVALARLAGDKASVPVALHLDHGTSFEQCVQCISSGFTSVMIDGSKHALEDNIALTNRVLSVARAVGVSVEAELGKIGGTEDDIHVDEKDALFTDPEEARYFVEKTGVDALAVAIGTAHGQYKGRPELDFERLSQIEKLVDVPLVLHGSSGVPDEDIRRAIEIGVRKVNIDTNLREAFTEGVRDVINAKPNEIDPRKILGPAKERMSEVIREKIRLFGSSNQA